MLELQQNLGPGKVVTTYTYNTANELETAQQGSVTTQYTYDANGSLVSDGVKTYTYDSANRLVEVDDGSAVVSLAYNGLGQRLSMDAAGVIAHYVLDTSSALSAGSDQPLTADSNGNTTYYLYGLGAISEKTTDWAYSLPDGVNTPRQLADPTGEITLSARYTPWGDTLDIYGTGNFSFGYLGGILDATTGLLYVGNGQYYDPATGRFLTRDAKPYNSNPYVPWDPTGAMLGPLGLLALVYGRKKKGNKAGMLLVLLLVGASVGMTLAACQVNNPTNQNVTFTATQPQGSPTATVIWQTPTSTGTATVTPPAPLDTLTPTCTPTSTPVLSTAEWLKQMYGVQLLNGSDNSKDVDSIWDERRTENARRAVEDVAQKFSRVTGSGSDKYGAFRKAFNTYSEDLVLKKVHDYDYAGENYEVGAVTRGPHLIEFARIDYVRDDSMRNNIVHEFGHAFSSGHSFDPELSIPDVFRNNRSAYLHDNSTVMWQAHQSSLAAETFADMFLAYTYDVWRDPIDINTLKKEAPANPEYWDPPKWMDDNMRSWLE